jgi:hypothetical protein
LKFFLEQSIPELFTTNQAALWTESLDYRCTAGSAIYHAALAVGYAHQAFLSTTAPTPDCTVALEHYQHALVRTKTTISSATVASRVISEEVALACVLFICFELLSGHDERALYHLEGGLKIASDMEDGSQKNATIVAVSKTLLDLDLQALAFIKRRQPSIAHEQDETIQGPLGHGSLMSRAAFIDFLTTGHKQVRKCCYFVRSQAQQHKYSRELPMVINDKRVRYLLALERWLEKVRSMLKQEVDMNRASSHPAGPLQKLLIVLLVTIIKLSCCLSPLESSYDTYETQFFEITELAEAILDVHRARPVRKRFTLHCSVVEPLYFTSCKCRSPSIRRRAIQQLERAGYQGGWNGSTVASVARKVVEFEERRCQGGVALSEARRQYGVRESERVHEVTLDFFKAVGLVRASCSVRSGTGIADWEVKVFEVPV